MKQEVYVHSGSTNETEVMGSAVGGARYSYGFKIH